MANVDSTSNEQCKEKPATIHNVNSSTLHCIISNAHLLHQTGYDDKSGDPIYVGDTKDFSYLEGAADASITTIAHGVSVIGKLLVGQDKPLAYIDDSDISALGWLLNDLGASIVALQNIQTQASNAKSFTKRFN